MCLAIKYIYISHSRNFRRERNGDRWPVIFLSLVLKGNGRREEKGRNDFYFSENGVSAR